MSQKNNIQQNVKKRKKRAAIAIISVLAAVAAVITVIIVLDQDKNNTGSVTLEGPDQGFRNFGAEYKTVHAENNRILIPISELDGGTARYYKWPESESGKTIHFFALQSSDGVYRAAFDACDVCFKMGRGYSQEGDYMVCNNCGQRFQSALVNEVKGGCNPSPLRRDVDGEFLVIRTSDLEKGSGYFPPFN